MEASTRTECCSISDCPAVGPLALLFAWLLTRLAALALLIDIVVAVATTKIPMLAGKGFWATVHEARTDWSMLLGLVFLLPAAAGPHSIDARLARSAFKRSNHPSCSSGASTSSSPD